MVSWGNYKNMLHASKLDMNSLLVECLQLNFQLDGANVQMANVQSGGIPAYILRYKQINAAIAEICEIKDRDPVHVMVNIVAPGVIVPKHTDTVLHSPERWHLPVATSKDAFWWDEEDGFSHLPLGHWCGPIPYSILHRIGNLGTEPRVHLIVDIKKQK